MTDQQVTVLIILGALVYFVGVITMATILLYDRKNDYRPPQPMEYIGFGMVSAVWPVLFLAIALILPFYAIGKLGEWINAPQYSRRED